jgi:cytidylate kinase
MEKVIITIARQYGSGGKTLGKALAKDLGINCYDRELMRMASDESGIAEGMFGKVDEKLKKSPLFLVSKNVYQGQLIPPDNEDFTSNDNLFNYQAKIIKQLADMESCVIIGRCADYVLKDRKDVVSVFVHAPHDYCMMLAKERLGYSEKEVEKYIAKTDKYRAEYYKYHTGNTWYDARNYDLCLDSSRLTQEKCIAVIKDYIKHRF